jgi:uncharacterized protein YcbK (DUF882 family)
MNLSKNFTLSEFTESATASKYKLDNTPSPEVIKNLEKLCVNCLQKLRDKIGMPIKISSGYRSILVNKKVKGSDTSQHIKGEAADIKVEGLTPKQLYNYILNNGIPFDQLILEPTWVHISWSSTRRRRQFWVQK